MPRSCKFELFSETYILFFIFYWRLERFEIAVMSFLSSNITVIPLTFLMKVMVDQSVENLGNSGGNFFSGIPWIV